MLASYLSSFARNASFLLSILYALVCAAIILSGFSDTIAAILAPFLGCAGQITAWRGIFSTIKIKR